ncbi:MAG: DUF2147 domain-containing protein [Xanthomonadaceae bacterium]|nr:DUF2147 domain-containing protein [Xanthomonadaceae bacterium]
MKKTGIAILVAMPLLMLAMAAAANDSPTGRWKTIDDATGQVKSIVEISQSSNGTLSGKVLQVLRSDHGPHPVCSECDGGRHNQPIEGMTILWNLSPDGASKWSGGTILDPVNGKTYRSKVELQAGGDRLNVSGCIAFICRTQTWQRD